MSTPSAGYLLLVLHCHLPYVRHPEHDYFLEETWAYEALFETYLPLLETFDRLDREGIPGRAVLSISPTLLSMWMDPLLQQRSLRYVDDLIALAQRERKRLKGDAAFLPVVDMYLERLTGHRRRLLEDCGMNVAQGFKRHQEKGRLEIITCAATHGYLPLLGVHEEAVRAQVGTALRLHGSFFGRKSPGFWLPECGYQPGHDAILAEFGVKYFFLESHGLLQALPRPKYGTFAPVACPSGTAAFGRDQESSTQVWSSTEGYPGHPDYREFYRDAGFDLKEGDLHPYLKPEGLRRFTGLKYYRVTGPTDRKEPYDPVQAGRKAWEHAGDFLAKRRAQLAEAAKWMDRPPLAACLYDAELFGHWWYEGPEFLYHLYKRNAEEGGGLRFTSPSRYLERHPENQPLQPVFSSWGLGGYSEFWLNAANDWIYPHLNAACDVMSGLADAVPGAQGDVRRALDQAARELLLAQASDWAFMMKTGHHRSYAEGRVKIHIQRFHRLAEQARRRRVDLKYLEEVEERDPIFPDIDYRSFRRVQK